MRLWLHWVLVIWWASSCARAQTTELDRFVGVDLLKHRPSKQDSILLSSLIQPAPEEPCGRYDLIPWRIWKRETNRRPIYIGLLSEGPSTIPGGTSACVLLLDANLKNIQSWFFQTGWRNYVVEASLEYSRDLAADLIVLRTEPVVNGRPIAKEFFSLSSNQLRLVRIEDDRHKIVQNEYCFRNYEIGPELTAKSVDDWLALLESDNKAEVLAGLVFLGGRHIVEPSRRGWELDSKYAALFQQIMADPRVRDRLQKLRKSHHKWIRQAAELAAREPGERPLR